MKKYNPFRPGSIVNTGMFAGRIDEIEKLEQALFQAKNGNPSHFLIIGERGIGKSSLLYYMQKIAEGAIPVDEHTSFKFLIVNVEIDPSDNYQGLIDKIGMELRKSFLKVRPIEDKAKKVWGFLTRWELAGIKYNRDVTEPQELLDELIQAILEINNDLKSDGILILIDEADKATSAANLGEFVKIFTEKLTKMGSNNVLLGLAGIPTVLEDLKQSHESSLRVFQIFDLKPLTKSEITLVIERGIEEANKVNTEKVQVNDNAKLWISIFSEGYPHFIQQFGYSAFETDTDNLIDEKDVQVGAFKENGAFQQLGHKYFQGMYFKSINSDEYRKILNAMSKAGDNWISRKELMNQTGLKETTVSNAIKALIERDIIIPKPGKKGIYKLPTIAFAVWIEGQNKSTPQV